MEAPAPSDWPRLLPEPAFRGVIKQRCEDFFVEEIPAYEPCGSGEHLFLLVEKSGHTTPYLCRMLARRLGISEFDIGIAGMKDRWAVTRQWISIPAEHGNRLADFEMEGVRILNCVPHTNKLKTGHLRGNRFRVVVRGPGEEALGDTRKRLSELAAKGVPNYYGEQRFGRDGDSLGRGLEILSGRRKPKRGRVLRLELSAVQSLIFNRTLAARIERGLFTRAIDGDIMVFEGGKKLFRCEDPAAEQPRLDRFEIHPTGPLPGPQMMQANGAAGEIESEVIESAGIDFSAFERFRKLARGGRRPLRFRLSGADIELVEGGIALSFTLPAGAYATVLLRELFEIEQHTDQG
ncbi:MAG: tRNA pseudouridine(13) synthase TruD [Deltaproteobacteria bacterium]|nr:MAG: tRNA pseudouridine(13) synthase TruD [Deltaproteobacteria bacterium]